MWPPEAAWCNKTAKLEIRLHMQVIGPFGEGRLRSCNSSLGHMQVSNSDFASWPIYLEPRLKDMEISTTMLHLSLILGWGA
jgi:hypothetical protein